MEIEGSERGWERVNLCNMHRRAVMGIDFVVSAGCRVLRFCFGLRVAAAVGWFWLLFTCAPACSADFSSFLDGVDSLSADFVQQVYAEDGQEINKSQGNMLFLRPGKFLWHYSPPTGLLIWVIENRVVVYDQPLNQAHSYLADASVGGIPLMLFSEVGDGLDASFDIKCLDKGDRLQWFRFFPKTEDGNFQYFDLALDESVLSRMVLFDHFSQRTVIYFDKVLTNIALSDEDFSIDLPQNVEVEGLPIP